MKEQSTIVKKSPILKIKTPLQIRFSEVDSLRIVWHGHYIRYFEDGREDFAKQHGLGYMQVYRHGFSTPIVKATCDYKRMLTYEDSAWIETSFVNSEAAKIIFKYEIYRQSDEALVASGETVQVFLDKNKELVLNQPAFFIEWKKEQGLI